ncbi:MAG: type II toxin-antitoxin system HipA family toxin [Lachnospiraceae bacterium]|nr:type II toxin-antitoxin system HipA family toxin [Lachnospiraceae bacterium]
MKQLDVSIEIRGEELFAGCIKGEGAADACFCYAGEYLCDDRAAPISVHLPLREEPFTPQETKTFFDGLLPEGFTRRSVAGFLRTSEEDYLSILAGLGSECLGAIRITGEDTRRTAAAYQRISKKRIRQLAGEGATESAQMVVEARLSLTGASGKAGLYYDGKKHVWYLPSGDAPSTHIVKQSHVRLEHIVTNEQLVMRAASKLGIEVPDSFIIDIGKGGDGEVLFACKRYDRDVMSERLVDGLPCPYRRHQEDVAQALGIPASAKYEEEGTHYFKRTADLIRSCCADPITDLRRLWDITVFNRLVGNTDNHIKNLSLLYTPDLKAIRLAPAYDLLSTIVYPASTRNMAFHIGGTYRLDDIDREAFRRAAADIGIGRALALERFDVMTERMPQALSEAADELAGNGFHRAGMIAERILSHFFGK